MDWAEVCNRLRANAEDEDAWTSLEARVLVWARRDLAGSHAAAIDDAVQDTLVSVLLALDHARSPFSFQGFVQGHYWNVRNRVWRVRRSAPLEEDAAVSPPPPEPVELSAALSRCLDGLTWKHREAVTLRVIEDLSYQTVAARMQVTMVNTRAMVCRGLAQLRECLGSPLATLT